MPEYSVPYAIHLLAFHQETASATGEKKNARDEEDEDVLGKENKMIYAQEASQKLLKQRLKCLIDPLIQSLGAGAKNVSTVLRLVVFLICSF